MHFQKPFDNTDEVFARMDVTIGRVVLFLMRFVPHTSIANIGWNRNNDNNDDKAFPSNEVNQHIRLNHKPAIMQACNRGTVMRCKFCLTSVAYERRI